MSDARRAVEPLRLTLALCFAEILSMAGTMTFPALVPTFLAEWSLTTPQIGWIDGAYQAGYVAGVPLLIPLTDRIDPRRIYAASCAIAAFAWTGFAVLADGYWSALAFRALGGVGLAGTYMPGLRILSDLVVSPKQGRYLSFYTATFGVGSSASVLLAGFVANSLGWRAAFGVAAVGTVLAAGVVLTAAPRIRPAPAASASSMLDFRPVLRHRGAMGYVLAYAAHCWELFGFRGWIVTFLVFSLALSEGRPFMDATPPLVAAIATVLLLLGLPASILGNEVATRYGRRRFLVIAMLVSGAVAAILGFAAALPFAIVVAIAALYAVTVNWDSASLTVGAVTFALPGRRGATMAVHSFLGFGAAFLGSVAFGEILEFAGGRESPFAWGVAFAAQGAVVALGPVFLLRLAAADAGGAPPRSA